MTYYSIPPTSDELYHYGIKGMRWGVRRYENPDGTLTEAGKKRYSNGDKAYRHYKRRLRKQRAKVHGGSNRWMHTLDIGDNSKSVISELKSNRDRYRNSDEYKTWRKQQTEAYDKASRAFDRGNYKLYEKYQEIGDNLTKNRPVPKKDIGDTPWSYSVYSSNGKKLYDDSGRDFIKYGGKKLTQAYLMDLGLDSKSAKYVAEQMKKKNRTLGDK